VLDRRSVLGKAQCILDAFTPDATDLGLAEIVDRTGLPKGTAHRLAGDLVTWGLLERRGGRYQLGLRLFELGLRVPQHRSLRDTALPFMGDVYQATREAVHLGVREAHEVLYLEKLIGHQHVSAPSQVGGRMPLYCTAIGKALLAFSPPVVFEEIVEQGLLRRTPRTITNPVVLRAQFDQARATRLAFEREESSIGLACAASPIFGAGNRLVGALSVAAPTSRYSSKRLGAVVLASARGLSRALGANL
jgi:DNA-binding IclR family transcriptional regulator